jgi:osmotically inducible protein OsmC
VTLVHSLEDTSPHELRLLGVFRPAGSPAEAYYPDGPAPCNQRRADLPKIERTAHIVWEGNLARGSGTISAATDAFTALPYSAATRAGQPGGNTSPEELLAAAHGSCYAMSLAAELTELEHPAGRLEVSCKILMDELEGRGHQIVGSVIHVVGDVEGIDAAAYEGAVARADERCPFSELLKRAGATVSIETELAPA